MTNPFHLTSEDDAVIVQRFSGGDHPFYAQDMHAQNNIDLMESAKLGTMTAIVSEEHGGIIGYCLEEKVAEEITTILNLHTIQRERKEEPNHV